MKLFTTQEIKESLKNIILRDLALQQKENNVSTVLHFLFQVNKIQQQHFFLKLSLWLMNMVTGLKNGEKDYFFFAAAFLPAFFGFAAFFSGLAAFLAGFLGAAFFSAGFLAAVFFAGFLAAGFFAAFLAFGLVVFSVLGLSSLDLPSLNFPDPLPESFALTIVPPARALLMASLSCPGAFPASTLLLAIMCLRIAWREDPPFSLSSEMALTISALNGGCSDGLAAFLALAGFLAFAAFFAGVTGVSSTSGLAAFSSVA